MTERIFSFGGSGTYLWEAVQEATEMANAHIREHPYKDAMGHSLYTMCAVAAVHGHNDRVAYVIHLIGPEVAE